MSIQKLVNEYIKIKEAEKKLEERKYRLGDKLKSYEGVVEVVDNVVWKVVRSSFSDFRLSRIGSLSEEENN